MLSVRFSGAAALVFVLGTTAAGAAPVPGPSGYGEIAAQALWNTPGSDYNTWSGIELAGRGNFWLAPAWSTQLDLSTSMVGSSLDDARFSDLTAAVHLSRRDPMRGLIGLFGGVSVTTDYCCDAKNGAWLAGVEGQYYWNNVTLYGQAGIFRQMSGRYGGADPLYQMREGFVQGTLRYFPQPRTKLEASLGYIGGTIWGTYYYGSDYAIHALTFSAEAEHQFDGKPLSVFARVSGFTDSNYTSGPAHEYAVLGGFRYRFGGKGTLQDEDRSGATLKVMDLDPIAWERWDD